MKVGDKFLLVDQRYGYGRSPTMTSVTVTKVGRKWATLDDSTYRPTRVDLKTMRAEGGRGKLYRDIDAYYAERCRNEAWRELRSRMANWPATDITEAAVRQAADLLGIAIP